MIHWLYLGVFPCRSFKLDVEEGLLIYVDHLFPPSQGVEPDSDTRADNITRARDAISCIKSQDELFFKFKKIYFR